MNLLPGYNYILASKSPRRKELLKMLGVGFRIETKDVEENYPDTLKKEDIPVFLAELKAKPFLAGLKNNELLITADTIVLLDGEVLGKPNNAAEAKNMLLKLSENEHKVITGVCLASSEKKKSFSSVSKVIFRNLTTDEIDYYISKYKPFDKAGAYGIQEWIGAIGITGIEGSFYNVMGLPVQKLYSEIIKF